MSCHLRAVFLLSVQHSVFAVEDPKDTLHFTALVKAYIPQAFLKENSGSELTYMIPTEADKGSFKGLFQALDENLQHLHVTGYGISDTTLEEVTLFSSGLDFLKINYSFLIIL